MVEKIINYLTPFFSVYGYYFVFFGIMLETSAFLGLIIPGETIILLACVYAGRGDLNIFIIVPLVILGAILGDNIGYWIGYKGGYPFALKYGKYFFVKKEYLAKAEQYYKEHGPKTVMVARFTAFLRGFAAVAAGISKMNYKKFFFYDAIGAILWSFVISIPGYFFGQNMQYLKKALDLIGIGILILFIILIVLHYLRRRKKKSQLFT